MPLQGKKIIDRFVDFNTNGLMWDEIERGIHITTFRKSLAQLLSLTKDATFDLMFTLDIMELIVSETNRYAEPNPNHPSGQRH